MGEKDPAKLALVLPGGGARGAYQAGVMRAVGEISEELGIASPFKIITGISAGAINASYLAGRAENFSVGAKELTQIWNTIKPDDIFKTDFWSLVKIGARWLYDLMGGGVHRQTEVQALLDTSPLRIFLSKHLNFTKVRENLDTRALSALAITATDYANSNSVTFVESKSFLTWIRKRRLSRETRLGVEHVMASAAIPLFFPSIEIENRYFGDGALRNLTPLSPAIHLGASKLLIVSVKVPVTDTRFDDGMSFKPSAARVISVIMNSILLDQVDFDVERLSRINQTLQHVSNLENSDAGLRPVDFLWIQPSEDIGELARTYAHNLPWMIRYFIRGLGSLRQASEIISYLLFDPEFCSRLTDLGYRDGLKNRAAIESLLR